MFRTLALVCLFTPALCLAQPQTREQKVRGDRDHVTAAGYWIYNDLPAAFARAKLTDRPIVVVLRCIPCEECVKLDDNLVEQDPAVRSLLDQFVCVRQVSTNGLDLSLFQYDTDQSFAVFFLNADGAIYGRFGTRSHRTQWQDDVSIEGLGKALAGALELHRNYAQVKESLAGKRGGAFLFAHPEDAPSLKEKYASSLDYAGNVVKSCIHCHQIGDAQREFYRAEGKPIPDEVLFPYPHPKAIGLKLDPKTCATVLGVASGSPAAQAGFEAGDQIKTLAGQPLLSLADVQWALHLVPATGGTLTAQIDRAGRPRQLMLNLADGWRQADDISWRVTSWGLRRMATGGMKLEPLAAEERTAAKLPSAGMALRAQHVGEYGEHAAAKKAGFRKGDVIVKFDGKADLPTEADVFRYGVQQRRPGDKVPVVILREGQEQSLQLPMQP
jgi:S1-C subfamily serine protease